MGWDGSGNVDRTDGTRTGVSVWADAAAANVKILAVDHDTHDQDLADAIENALARDGQNAASADLDIGSNKLINVADGTATNDAINFGQFFAHGSVGSASWTPTLTDGTTAVAAYAQQTGRYMQFGKLFVGTFRVSSTAANYAGLSGTGTVTIGNFPVTFESSALAAGAGIIMRLNGYTLTTGQWATFRPIQAQTVASWQKTDGDTVSSLQWNDASGTVELAGLVIGFQA